MHKPVKFFAEKLPNGNFYAISADKSLEVVALSKEQLLLRCLQIARMGQKNFIPVVVDFYLEEQKQLQ